MIVTTAAAASISATAAGWYLAPMMARRLEERRLRRRCSRSRSLVLTFDDGPGPRLTPRVLDLLRERGARATFFLCGVRAAAAPEVVDRIAADGHEIGNHGHAHLNAWRTAPWRSAADISAGYRALDGWIGGDGPYRPPYGKLTLLSWALLRRRGARLGWWTIVGGDVEERLPGPDLAVRRAERAGGGVVLLHDFDRGPERGEFVLKSTRLLLDAAERRGWSVRTLGEVNGERGENAD